MTRISRLPNDITEFETLHKSLQNAVHDVPGVGAVYTMSEDTVHTIYDAGFAMAVLYMKEQREQGWDLEETYADLIGHINNSARGN